MEKNGFDAWDSSVIIEILFCFERKGKIFSCHFVVEAKSEAGYPVPLDAASYHRTTISSQGSVKRRYSVRNRKINSLHKDY